MAVLGLHIGHDAGAAVVKNGQVMMVAEAEKIFDAKHISGLEQVKLSAKLALEAADIPPAEIEAVFVADEDVLSLDRAPGISRKLHTPPYAFPLKGVERFGRLGFRLDDIGIADDVPFHLVCHSLAHAAGALYMSGFEDCAVLIYDGYGTCCGTMAYRYRNGILTRLEGWHDKFLMGHRYSAFGGYLRDIEKRGVYGESLDWAGKVMGLHAYGMATAALTEGFRKAFYDRDFLRYNATWQTRLPQYEDFVIHDDPREPPGLMQNCLSARDPDDLAIVASMQAAFTDVVYTEVKELLRETKADRLLLGGGCGLNIVANQRIATLHEIDELFISPNCDDRGIASGVAVVGDCFLSGRRLHQPSIAVSARRSPYQGLPLLIDLPQSEWATSATPLSLDLGNVTKIAKLLAEQKIVGLIQGRCEIGPRALGHRSILASASRPAIRDLINQKIKAREWWRPFAPVCRSTDAAEYFDLPVLDPYMLIGGMVRREYREVLGAVTHVDGSTRVQTLMRREDNPWLWDLLTATKEITGVGVLLNTSYNAGGKPLANRMSAVLDLLNSTQLDGVWCMEHWLVKKSPADRAGT